VNIWKVCSVYRDGDTMHSAIIGTGAMGSPYRLLYEVGKTTAAVAGTLGIMCFDRQENAKEFAMWLGDEVVVLLCTTEHEPEELRCALFSWDVSCWNELRGSIHEAALRSGGVTAWPTYRVPLGTVTVPSLTVVGIV